ncbi:MAG: GAF domain-containing protein [Ignavibacteria bacterium]
MPQSESKIANFISSEFQSDDFKNSNYKFPFKVNISFIKLIEHIEAASKCDNDIKKEFAGNIIREINKNPGIRDTFNDPKDVKPYEKLLSSMMMFVFPDVFWEKQTFALSTIFKNDIIYSSPKYREIIMNNGNEIEGELNIDDISFNFGTTIGGFAIILNQVYGFDFRFEFPIIYKIPHPETGLDRYYKLNMANEFADVKVLGKLKNFTDKERLEIYDRIYDIDFISKIIPPEDFEFSGFLVINAINITDTEILSAIKKDFIDKHNVSIQTSFLKLQHNIRSLLKESSVSMGLAETVGSNDLLFRHGNKVLNNFQISSFCNMLENRIGSVYDICGKERRVIIINDLENYPEATQVEKNILKKGYRNLLVAPLIYDDKVLAILELASYEPSVINSFNTLKLTEVFSLLGLSIARYKDEFDKRIQSVIKEKCTAIHPSIEWKFRNAAVEYLFENEDENLISNDQEIEMEEIIVKDVYPLYGLSDIRNSSVIRNDSIKNDLIENLEMINEILNESLNYKPLYILKNLIYRIEKKIKSLNFAINSGDENGIMEFLNSEVYPLFEIIGSFNKKVYDKIDKFRNEIDNDLGIIYKRRKDFEKSSSALVNMISAYLDAEQEKIQKMYPHYFERYKTDGVEHSIYIGAALNEDGHFDNLYLKNIRLWQLILTCGIVCKVNELESKLSIPLQTAQLILVQNTPLTIRFRYDEKRFDVDGTYNIRYEIMKKRIDKAEIKGTEERLTQPGKIAIVYSQTSEEKEYLRYIDYLQSEKYLTKEIEKFDLSEMQGLSGMKALRVTVNTDSKDTGKKIDTEKLLKVSERMN